jgi:hypothetical protein
MMEGSPEVEQENWSGTDVVEDCDLSFASFC